MDFGEEWHLAAKSKPIDIRQSTDDQRNTLKEKRLNMVSPSKPNNETEEELFKTINELYMNVIQNNNPQNQDTNDRLTSNVSNDTNRNNCNPIATTRPWNANEKPNKRTSKIPKRRISGKQNSKIYNENQQNGGDTISSGEETDESEQSIDKIDDQQKQIDNETEKLTDSQENLVSELKSILDNVTFDWRHLKVEHNDKKMENQNDKPVNNGAKQPTESSESSETSENDDDDDDDEEYWHFKIEHNDLHKRRMQEKQSNRSFSKSNSKIRSRNSSADIKTNKTKKEHHDSNPKIKHNQQNGRNETEPNKKIKLEEHKTTTEYTTTSSDDNDEDEEFYHFKINPNYPQTNIINMNSTNIETNELETVTAKKSNDENTGFDWSNFEEKKESETETDTGTGISSNTGRPIVTFQSESDANSSKRPVDFGTTDNETISTDNDDEEEFWHFEIDTSQISSVTEIDKNMGKSEESEATTLKEDDAENTFNEYDTITSIPSFNSKSKSKSILEDEGFDWDFYENEEETNEKNEENEEMQVDETKQEPPKENGFVEVEANFVISLPARKKVIHEEPWWVSDENDEKNQSINEDKTVALNTVEESEIEANFVISLPVRRNLSPQGGWWLSDDEDNEEENENNENSMDIDLDKNNQVEEKIEDDKMQENNEQTSQEMDNKQVEEDMPIPTIPVRRNWTEAEAWWLDDEEVNDSSKQNNDNEQQMVESKNDVKENCIESKVPVFDKDAYSETENVTEIQQNESNCKEEQNAEYAEEEETPKLHPIRRNWTEEGPWWLDDDNELEQTETEKNTELETELNTKLNEEMEISENKANSKKEKEIVQKPANDTELNTNIEPSKNKDIIEIKTETTENETIPNSIKQNCIEQDPWWLDDEENDVDDENKENNEQNIIVTNKNETNIMKEQNTKLMEQNSNETKIEKLKNETNEKEEEKVIKYVKRNWSGDSPWWADDDDVNDDDNDNDYNQLPTDNITQKLNELNRQDDSEIEDGEEEWTYEEVSEDETNDESYDSDERRKRCAQYLPY